MKPGLTVLCLVAVLDVVGCASGAGGTSDAAIGVGAGGSSGSGGVTATTDAADMGAGDVGTGGAIVVESSGCPFFTPDDPWRRDVSNAAVDAALTAKMRALLGSRKLSLSYSKAAALRTNDEPGIPINIVPESQPPVDVRVTSGRADPGTYPFPGPGMVVLEGPYNNLDCEGTCRLIVVQRQTCLLFEGQSCSYYRDNGWQCNYAAKWDLKRNSYNQRKDGPLNADIAGLPLYAGLARYEEAAAGRIEHALRINIECANAGFIAPATHGVELPSSRCVSDPNALPLGLRLRLKNDYDATQMRQQAQTLVRTLKTYGLILSDDYGDMRMEIEDHPGWRSDVEDLKSIPAAAFEVVAP